MFRRFFSSPRAVARGQAGWRAYAVGDVHGCLDLLEFRDRAFERFTVTQDPDALPHYALNAFFHRGRDRCVTSILCGTVRRATHHRQLTTILGGCFAGPRTKHQSFKQRVRRKAVRTMNARTRYFTGCI